MKFIKIFMVICNVLLGMIVADAQIVISGQVTEKGSGQSVSEVTIRTANSKTSTDSSGFFTITVPGLPVTIFVEHIAFKPERLEKTDNGFLRIVLEHVDNVIDEVPVYTGYQRIPKERATGSFETLGENKLMLLNTANVLDRLEGNSSLLFDKNSRRPAITLRGLSTINGSKSPLVVLDNFPFEGDLASINPNDIESVTLLKDAAASSIWGVRAGNGVIVITTKKGNKNSGSTLTFQSNIQLQAKPDLMKLDYIGSADLIQLERDLFEKGHYDRAIQSSAKTYWSPMVTALVEHKNGVITDKDLEQLLEELGNRDNRTQFMEDYYRPAVDRQYALNHTLSKDKITLFNSLSYYSSNDNLENTRKRFTYRNNGTFEIGKKTALRLGLMFSNNENKNGKPGYEDYSTLHRYINLWDEGGQEIGIPAYNPVYMASIAGSGLQDWNQYLASDYQHTDNRTLNRVFYGNLNLEHQLSPGLKLDMMYNPMLELTDQSRIYDAGSFYARDMINRYTTIDNKGNLLYNLPYGGIVDNNRGEKYGHNARGQVSYSGVFGEHAIDFILGAEIRTLKTLSNSNREYGFDPEVLLTGMVNYNTAYRDFVSGATIYIPYGGGYKQTNNHNISQFFNGSYSYKGRYVLSGSIRRDASNIFGLNTNEKWNPLWSTGLSWDIGKEKFLDSDQKLSQLKMKVTYGKSGLINPASTAITVLDYRTAAVTNYKSAVPYQFPNPELRWEKSSMLNIGLDFGLFRDFLSGSIAYYKKWGSDLFGPAPMDISAGVGETIVRNVANMEGSGVDVNLSVRWFDRPDFSWSMEVLANGNKTTVTNYHNPETASYLMLSQGGSINPIVGKPVYSILSYAFEGLDNEGDPVSRYDGDPSTDYVAVRNAPFENLVYSGPAMPTFHGTINNQWRYKGLSLAVNLQYKFGHYVKGPLLSYNNLVNMIGHNGSGQYTLRWQKTGDELYTSIPAFKYPLDNYREEVYTASTAAVKKAGHLRLQYVRIGYDLKVRHIRNLQIFCTAQNLGIIWKRDKELKDPDYPLTLAPQKQFTFGFLLNL